MTLPRACREDRCDHGVQTEITSETKVAGLALAIVRIADRDGAPCSIGVDQLRQSNPRLTPLAIGQMTRRHRDIVETVLADRGYKLIDYSDYGPNRGMDFEIGTG